MVGQLQRIGGNKGEMEGSEKVRERERENSHEKLLMFFV